jgi:hypothetical protein
MMEVGYPLTAGNRQIAWRVLLPWRRHREWRTDVADYIMLRHASHCGTKTLIISPEKAPDECMAMIVVRNRKTNEAVRYAEL